MVVQAELFEIYVDEGQFDEDFEFLGEDGNMYLFDVDTFDYLVKNYGESNLLEVIQGNLQGMLTRNIITLIE